MNIPAKFHACITKWTIVPVIRLAKRGVRFDEVQCVGYPDQTLSRMFDLILQTNQQMARKERKDNRQRCVNINLIIFFVWPWWIINDVEEEKNAKDGKPLCLRSSDRRPI